MEAYKMDLFRPESVVDKESPIPAYQQIATNLIDRIAQEEWSVGDRLPSENELAEYYGVARVTLRQAMSLLEKNNLIVKQQGRGIFVSASPKIFTQNIRFPHFGSTKDPQENPISSSNLEIIRIEHPDKYVRKQLKIDENTPVVYVKRIFISHSIVIGLNRAWLPAHKVPDMETSGLIDASISKTIEFRYNLEIINIDNFVESVKLNAVDAKLLDSVYGTSALKINSIHCLSDHTPIEYAYTLWLSDYASLQFTISK